jgi:CBS domain-containing protein
LSIWAIERMNPKSKSPDKLDKLALSVQPDSDFAILRNLRVRDAMDTNYLRLSDRLDILAAGLKLTQNNCHSALVIDDRQELLGIITLHDLSRAISQAEASLQTNRLLSNSVGSICTKHLFYADIDEPITEAIDRMNARGLHQLPVIDSGNPDRVVGILQQERIALACSIAATRQALSKYDIGGSIVIPIKSPTQDLLMG